MFPGIGYEVESIPLLFEQMKTNLASNWKDMYVDNQRFFNRKWQMIGSHSNYERIKFYRDIRKDIPYVKELEKEIHFNRWLTTTLNGQNWNIVKERKKNLMANGKMPLVLDTRPKISIPKMLPSLRR